VATKAERHRRIRRSPCPFERLDRWHRARHIRLVPQRSTTATPPAIGVLSDVNARAGDKIRVDDQQPVDIKDVSGSQLLLWAPWAGGNKIAVGYELIQDYPARVVGVAAAEDVGDMLAALMTVGPIYNVPSTDSAPDLSDGVEGQYAHKANTEEWWQRTGGVWTPTVGQVAGYGGTSATSLAIANSTTKVFATQANLAYNGAKVRAASSANPANYMEGVCTYSGTTLTMTVDAIGGSGTKADWLLSIAGQPAVGGLRGTRVVGGTTDAILNADLDCAVIYSNTGAVAVSLAQAGAAGQFSDGWAAYILGGDGTITITPTTSQINGQSSVVIAPNTAFSCGRRAATTMFLVSLTKPL
jgi:hypothetical protein